MNKLIAVIIFIFILCMCVDKTGGRFHLLITGYGLSEFNLYFTGRNTLVDKVPENAQMIEYTTFNGDKWQFTFKEKFDEVKAFTVKIKDEVIYNSYIPALSCLTDKDYWEYSELMDNHQNPKSFIDERGFTYLVVTDDADVFRKISEQKLIREYESGKGYRHHGRDIDGHPTYPQYDCLTFTLSGNYLDCTIIKKDGQRIKLNKTSKFGFVYVKNIITDNGCGLTRQTPGVRDIGPYDRVQLPPGITIVRKSE